MFRLVILSVFILLSSITLFSQENNEKTKLYKNDISFNVTSLIGNLLSLNTSDTGVPYLISYRRHNGVLGFRISLAGDLSRSRNNFFSNRNSESYFNLRLGLEKINQISSRVAVSYGVDVVANYFYEESTLFTSNGVFFQEDVIKEIGLGPSIRLFYEVNPRITFHTESSLYGLVGRSNTTYDSNFIQDESEDTFRLSLAIPQALFITLSF